jgi:hypothetical protein
MTVALTQENVFGNKSPHRVVAPNKVVELREGSLVLEKEFEGSTELHFFVRHVGIFGSMANRVEMRSCIRNIPAVPYARRC